MTEITRSAGTPLTAGAVCYGFAGGGYQGLTLELDATVAEAAEALAGAYGVDVTIRFNSDRASGSAWLRTHEQDGIGANAEVGVGASLVTAAQRAHWERWAHEAGDDFPQERDYWQGALQDSPEGQLTVHAHISATSADPGHLPELRELPGWMDMSGRPSAYHHGAADSVTQAVDRCLRYAPPSALLNGYRQAPGSAHDQR
jgi:hypothetical protein